MENNIVSWTSNENIIFGGIPFLYMLFGLFLAWKFHIYKNSMIVINERQKGITDENREIYENARKKNKRHVLGMIIYLVVPIIILYANNFVYVLNGGKLNKIPIEWDLHYLIKIICTSLGILVAGGFFSKKKKK